VSLTRPKQLATEKRSSPEYIDLENARASKPDATVTHRAKTI
jgi:hypothetical protein